MPAAARLPGASVLVLVSDGDEAEEVHAQILAGPLWPRLPAVQAGRVWPAPNSWLRAGYLSADALLDDVVERYGRT